jgi:hypothetical protein
MQALSGRREIDLDIRQVERDCRDQLRNNEQDFKTDCRSADSPLLGIYQSALGHPALYGTTSHSEWRFP